MLPCILIQFTKMTDKMKLCRIIYFFLASLHVSSVIFAHHQEHLNCITASYIIHVCRCRQRHTCVIPEAVIQFRCSWFFFFFRWRYSPLWGLACRKMSVHFVLPITNSLHLLTPITWRSLSTSSLHPFLGLPLRLVPSSSWVKIFLGILSSSILSRWPSQLILCPFIHFTIFSSLLNSSLDAPDDERKYRSKHVEQPRNNNLSYTVASCRSFSYIIAPLRYLFILGISFCISLLHFPSCVCCLFQHFIYQNI
jgi:hypothetical protein